MHAQIYTAGILVRHAGRELQDRFLPGIAAGRTTFLTMALTEHDAGLNTTALTTQAARDGDSYVLTGEKNWVSRLQHTDLMLVFARTAPLEVERKTQASRRSSSRS